MSKGYRDAFPVESDSSANVAGRKDAFASPPEVFPGVELLSAPREDKVARYLEILEQGIHGIAFSPYIGKQRPGTPIGEAQIRERLRVLQPHVDWIRTFSCIEGNEDTPRVAHEMGLKTMVGVGLGDDRDKNERELLNGIRVAQAGHADILAVGNEILLREDLPEDELIGYIERAREAVPDVPVSYVDAYFLFEKHPRVTAACDLLLINCYPFWEKCPLEHSLFYMQEMVRRTEAIAGGKRIIISETGWPSEGTPFGAAIPGEEEALTYFINAVEWTREAGIELFYFSSFDESWKVDDEGDVGAFWGLWDNAGQLKYRRED